jgi:FemAB-related protein (PEP-CTERM system-associated)
MNISTVSMKVKRLEVGDIAAERRWDDFVNISSRATFFHRAGWQRIIVNVFGHKTFFLYVESGGHIVAILPLAHVDSLLFGRSLVSLPFAVYAGVVSESSEATAALEAEARDIAGTLDVDYLEYRNVAGMHDDWPSQDLYVTFRKAILTEVDANLLEIPRKQRAMIRKGIKNNLTSRIDRECDAFFNLYTDNVHRHGTPPMPKKYFSALLYEFGSDCEILTVLDSQGSAVSSVLSFYFRDEVLPYYAGDNVRARDLAANDFKYWELLRRSCVRGIGLFDFGRSKVGTGSFSFKKNWGFEAAPLHYEYQLFKCKSVPQNNPMNGKYRLLIAAWRKLPISFANFLGPFIVRNLG